MGRFYVRRTDRSIEEKSMNLAVLKVLNNEMSYRKACDAYSVARGTLTSRVKTAKQKYGDDALNYIKNLVELDQTQWEFQSKHTSRQIFSALEEEQLGEYAVAASNLHFGLSTNNFCRLAYEFAVALGKEIDDSWKGKAMATEDWYLGFMHRNDKLRLRKPENTSINRLRAVNKKNILSFFENYSQARLKNNISSDRIFNFDETGVCTVMDPPKVIARKGAKQVGQASSAERGSQITIGVFICTLKTALPPVYILPKRLQNSRTARIFDSEGNLIDAAMGSLACFSENGWMTSESFLETLKHLKRFAHPSAESPILLIMDNHASHTSLENIKFAKENHIFLLTFPPHLTDRMQPLDVGVFSSFKSAMKFALQDEIDRNGGKPIELSSLIRISKSPLQVALSQKNIESGFSSTGIWPPSRLKYDDILLAKDEDEDENEENVDQPDSPNLNSPRDILHQTAISAPTVSPIATTSAISNPDNSPVATTSAMSNSNTSPVATTSAITNLVTSPVVTSTVSTDLPISTQKKSSKLTAHDYWSTLRRIRPLQTITVPKKQSTRAGKSTILTDTPEIKIREEKANKIAEMKSRKEERAKNKLKRKLNFSEDDDNSSKEKTLKKVDPGIPVAKKTKTKKKSNSKLQIDSSEEGLSINHDDNSAQGKQLVKELKKDSPVVKKKYLRSGIRN